MNSTEFGLRALAVLLVAFVGIVIPIKIAEYLARTKGAIFGYIFSVALLGVVLIFLRNNPYESSSEPIDNLKNLLIHLSLFGGGLAFLAVSGGKKKSGLEWIIKNNTKSTPVVVMPSPSPPTAQQPQTIIHYTDNRDQSSRIDNSVKIIVSDLNRDSARELLGLPTHFTSQRLENAYEDKIRILDAQAQALPRSDAKNRLLISQQEDRLEQAYEVLKREK